MGVGGWVYNISMLTDAHVVGRWVGLKNVKAYGCLRCICWVGGWKYPNAYGCFYRGGRWWFSTTLTKNKNNFSTLNIEW